MLASHQPDVIQSSLHEVTKYLLFSRVLRFFVKMSQSLICSCFQSSLVQLNDLNISMIATWRANAWRVKLFENKIQTIQKLPGGEVQIPDYVEPKLLKQIFKLKTTLILMQNIQQQVVKVEYLGHEPIDPCSLCSILHLLSCSSIPSVWQPTGCVQETVTSSASGTCESQIIG